MAGVLSEVTVTEVRELYVSKSVWHAQYIPCFQNIANNGDMVEWLEDSSEDGDENVWGFKKFAYQLSDLKEWLEHKKKGKQREMRKKKMEEKVVKKKTNVVKGKK
ncbi:hypothetical protein BYT27DRAFT_7107152 [Phlegmacium glaucopus]|nr:hypothetical protein BYT27DRAFT_7107152 [Phlegmacium glaucopus]